MNIVIQIILQLIIIHIIALILLPFIDYFFTGKFNKFYDFSFFMYSTIVLFLTITNYLNNFSYKIIP